MAQQVVIAGALFNDVPSISVPDSNSVYHPFVDPSVTTAAASDVAQGKQFIAADGTLTQGTASGGGTSIVWGHLRGDATLAKSWTYDKLIHADEGVTIPSYTTSTTTLKSGAEFTTENIDFSDYSYMVLYRGLATPVYSNSTKSSARQIYYARSALYDFAFIPESAFSHDGTTATANSNAAVYSSIGQSVFDRTVYYSSASNIRMSNASYGAYMTWTAPSITVSSTYPYETATVKITSPSFLTRGSTTYLNRTNWEYITDIRYQYIFELWRVPASATVHGWELESQFRHILDCANGNGTLT